MKQQKRTIITAFIMPFLLLICISSALAVLVSVYSKVDVKMTKYMITLKDGSKIEVEANSYHEAIDGTTVSRDDVRNVQELNVEKGNTDE